MPEVLVGGLLGVAGVCFFTGLAISAVGRTTQMVVEEVGAAAALSVLQLLLLVLVLLVLMRC